MEERLYEDLPDAPGRAEYLQHLRDAQAAERGEKPHYGSETDEELTTRALAGIAAEALGRAYARKHSLPWINGRPRPTPPRPRDDRGRQNRGARDPEPGTPALDRVLQHADIEALHRWDEALREWAEEGKPRRKLREPARSFLRVVIMRTFTDMIGTLTPFELKSAILDLPAQERKHLITATRAVARKLSEFRRTLKTFPDSEERLERILRAHRSPMSATLLKATITAGTTTHPTPAIEEATP